MPANFPEIWESRVINNLVTADVAPWLDGIPEMSSNVVILGEGSETEQNIIHVPSSDFEVDVLINNTTYPIAVQVYEDGSIQITLDKYQTKVVSLSDDQTMGASYEKIDNATRKLMEALLKSKYGKAIHSIAPNSAVAGRTPVLEATGPADATGRNILLYEDIVRGKNEMDNQEVDEEGRRLVLNKNHWNDLLLDRKRFGDQLINYRRGTPAPIIAGFELFSYINMPKYSSTLAKKAYGAIPAAGDRSASIAFHVNNIAKKTGYTKQYFKGSTGQPTTQANQLAYRHYFVATPFQARYGLAIV